MRGLAIVLPSCLFPCGCHFVGLMQCLAWRCGSLIPLSRASLRNHRTFLRPASFHPIAVTARGPPPGRQIPLRMMGQRSDTEILGNLLSLHLHPVHDQLVCDICRLLVFLNPAAACRTPSHGLTACIFRTSRHFTAFE